MEIQEEEIFMRKVLNMLILSCPWNIKWECTVGKWNYRPETRVYNLTKARFDIFQSVKIEMQTGCLFQVCSLQSEFFIKSKRKQSITYWVEWLPMETGWIGQYVKPVGRKWVDEKGMGILLCFKRYKKCIDRRMRRDCDTEWG